jgi:tetratricopeptide (TPR) repeat protein
MFELKYKTLNMSKPDGKPRIYFTCHYDDFDKYFEEISDSILKTHSCAIWYDTDYCSERDSEFYDGLYDIQLLVIPVTAALLSSDCRAIKNDFKFALTNKIPILPIMEEAGIETDFSQIFGNMQFLDRACVDQSAISYEEKLEKYLSSVLIKNEDYKKIHNEFSFRIFLSYRKKDRRAARELMRKIHSEQSCRDAAIWYDEYLRPGEDFRDSITEAIKASDLVVMAVTPSMVNEKNYVMQEEYPLALDLGKPILPIEIIPTDKNMLSDGYKRIPPCINADSPLELSLALMSVAERVSNSKEASSEHFYLIGLAYLGGIEVEVDRAKALSLITSAAEGGYIPAIKKLVEMYRSGHGVLRDYRKAIEWQEKSLFEIQRLPDMTVSLFSETLLCGDYYRELDLPDEALKKYLTAERLVHRLKNDSAEYKKSLWEINSRLGEIYMQKKDIPKALECYQTALSVAQEVASPQSRALSLLHIGTLCAKKESFSEALEHLSKAEALLNPEALSYSLCLEKMGKLYLKTSDTESARKYLEKALSSAEGVFRETNSVSAKIALSHRCNSLGALCRAEKELQDAIRLHSNAVEYAFEASKACGTLEARHALAESYFGLAEAQALSDTPDVAYSHYEKSSAIFRRIVQETGDTEAEYELALCLERLGEKRRDSLIKALEIYKKLCEINPHNSALREKAEKIQQKI